MGAVFPNGIKTFKPHRNRYDDVDAADINAIQDEVVAIESTVGPFIKEVNEALSTIEDDVAQLQDGQEELEAEQRGDNKTEANFRIRFKNLAERLNWMQNGGNIMAVDLTRQDNFGVGRVNGVLDGRLGYIASMPKPPARRDPYRLYNGHGITLRKAGFWLIKGRIDYSLLAKNGSKNIGSYKAFICTNGRGIHGTDITQTDTFRPGENVYLNASILAWFPRGTRINLRTAQNSGMPQIVSWARLSAVRFRG